MQELECSTGMVLGKSLAFLFTEDTVSTIVVS